MGVSVWLVVAVLASAAPAALPKYSCVGPPGNPAPVNRYALPARTHANGKLVTRGTDGLADPADNEQAKFAALLAACETAHPNLFQELLREFEVSSQTTTVYLHEHPHVAIAGEPRGGNVDTDLYFFRMSQLLAFPKAPPTAVPWATTRCMTLAHELKETLSGHAAGIDVENRLRPANVPRTGHGELRHGDHCDIVIPLGDHLERLHMAPQSYAIASITYQ